MTYLGASGNLEMVPLRVTAVQGERPSLHMWPQPLIHLAVLVMAVVLTRAPGSPREFAVSKSTLSGAAVAAGTDGRVPRRVPSTTSGAPCGPEPARAGTEAAAARAPCNACAATSGEIRASSETGWPDSVCSGTALQRRVTEDAHAHRRDPVAHLGADVRGGLERPPGRGNLHVLLGGTARVLHMHDRAVTNELGIQLVGQSIAAEFHIKIPQHFGLGQGEGTIFSSRVQCRSVGRVSPTITGRAQTAGAASIGCRAAAGRASLVRSVSMVNGR